MIYGSSVTGWCLAMSRDFEGWLWDLRSFGSQVDLYAKKIVLQFVPRI